MPLKSYRTQEVDLLVGDRIRFFRLQQGLSQNDVALKLGISYQQLHKYESGANSVSASRLADIARLLQIPIEALFDEVPPTPNDSAMSHDSLELQSHRERVQLLAYISQISDHQKRQALRELLQSLAASHDDESEA